MNKPVPNPPAFPQDPILEADRHIHRRLWGLGLMQLDRQDTVLFADGQRKILATSYRGILPGSGRSVRVAVCVGSRASLRAADIPEKEREELTEHARHGGWSLLLWSRLDLCQIIVLEWAAIADAFGPTQGLVWDLAEALALAEDHALSESHSPPSVLKTDMRKSHRLPLVKPPQKC